MPINLKSIQDTIGYQFKNPDLLQQAFVRRSYSSENGGQNNEVLEFIGDKALDLAVIKIMMERFGELTESKDYLEFKLRNPKYFKTKLKEGKFTDIKKDLVEKKALSACMDKLGFQTQLIMGHGDVKQNIQEQDSVKEDLFEAIIGAVTLDCDWNMGIITNVVSTMIDFDDYFENDLSDDRNYVGKTQDWSLKNGYGLPSYSYRYNSYSDDFFCDIRIGNVLSFTGRGNSKAKARFDAAKKTYLYLLNQGYIVNEYKAAVGEADYERSIAQINELVQKGLIEVPEYTFSSSYDENGCPLWTCEMSINNVKEGFVNQDYSKNEAKRQCAYEMLLYLMDEYKGE